MTLKITKQKSFEIASQGKKNVGYLRFDKGTDDMGAEDGVEVAVLDMLREYSYLYGTPKNIAAFFREAADALDEMFTE